MRKVLLATTALVAMSVTAAQADITISGAGVFEVEEKGSGQLFSSDGDIVISGSTTTDSGLTISAVHDFLFEGAKVGTDGASSVATGSNVADSYIDIAGDFGSVRMGNTDDALDRNDGALGSTMDIDGTSIEGSLSTEIGGNSVNISYIAPSVGGFTPYVAVQQDGTSTGYGFNFAAGPATITYQAVDASSDSSVIGVKFSAAGVTFGAGASAVKTNGVTTKTNDLGASYTSGDITLIGTYRKSGSDKYNTLGAKYAIAPGLTAAIENGSLSGSSSEDSTYASLTVAF
jgi:hypothetical protein